MRLPFMLSLSIGCCLLYFFCVSSNRDYQLPLKYSLYEGDTATELDDTILPLHDFVSEADETIFLDSANYNRQKRVLLFSIHVRKAGGSEVHDVLWKQARQASWRGDQVDTTIVHPVEGHSMVYNVKKYLPIGCTFPDIDRLVASEKMYKLHVLFGLFPWEALRAIPPSIEVLTTTVLRDPTERVISSYLYERRKSEIKGATHLYPSFKRGLSLVGYAKTQVLPEAGSYYMRIFCRCDCTMPYTQTDVELAKSRIQKVGVLGLTHLMSDYVRMLNERVWWIQEDPSRHTTCSSNCGSVPDPPHPPKNDSLIYSISNTTTQHSNNSRGSYSNSNSSGGSGGVATAATATAAVPHPPPPLGKYRAQYPEVARILDEGLKLDWELFRYAQRLVEGRRSRERITGVPYWRKAALDDPDGGQEGEEEQEDHEGKVEGHEDQGKDQVEDQTREGGGPGRLRR